ncbi:RloB domain-containing protein [Chryseobacterium indoltheticum]|uniref:RloB domain-containing protein n=1 Tax=Chryseobacterium indoltheticum TaxID=254 RepID=UPI003F49170C
MLDQTKKCKKGDKLRNQEFKEYFDEIVKYFNDKVVVIINNPCLEFWFLLHHQDTSKSFSNCGQTEKDLKKIKEFQKFEKKINFLSKGIDIFELTKKNIKTAIKNSKKLGEFDFKNPTKSICEMWKFLKMKI